MTLDQLDAELRKARASLRRLREETVRELTAEADAESNRYTREMLLAAAVKVSAIGKRR